MAKALNFSIIGKIIPYGVCCITFSQRSSQKVMQHTLPYAMTIAPPALDLITQIYLFKRAQRGGFFTGRPITQMMISLSVGLGTFLCMNPRLDKDHQDAMSKVYRYWLGMHGLRSIYEILRNLPPILPNPPPQGAYVVQGRSAHNRWFAWAMNNPQLADPQKEKLP